MRNRKQQGMIIRIGDNWYVRYWERRAVDGTLERKRVTHLLRPVTTRGKHPPADVKNEAAQHMAAVVGCAIPPERIVTIGEFVDNVYLPWAKEHKRPSTHKQYRDVWEHHLKARCASALLKGARTFHVQQWLSDISATTELSRNSLRRIKSAISGIFSQAKRLDYFEGENPARDTAIDPRAAEPQETYAYSLEEIQAMLAALPEPAGTAFAFAAFMGLRHGEIEGLRWEDYQPTTGEITVSRSIWHGHVNAPKTQKSAAPIPVIKPLAQRLEMHRLRSGNPGSGPIFANQIGKPMSMNNVRRRIILPAINRCEKCRKSEDHGKEHPFKRDERIPAWHGWHAARRGLGSNLYRLGVSDMVIQRILRHSNVSTTTTYYIKTVSEDVREAMSKLEREIPLTDTYGTLKTHSRPSTKNVN
jgi:integrase